MPVTTTNAPALEQVLAQLDAFKRKFYLNLLVRGALVAGGLLLTLFVVLNLLEYFLYLPTWVRGGLLFGFLGLVVYAFVHWIWQPLAALTNLRRLLSDEQAAARVGELFPQVQDKLLNALQLQGQARENALIAASLEQRASQLTGLEFAEGINIKAQTRPLWKYLAVPAGTVALLLLVWPSLFVQGTDRLLHYRRAYSPPAPFQFVIKNKDLRAFKNEDFKLEVAIEGKVLPNEISITYGGRERRLVKQAGNTFSYEFRQLQRDVEFQLSGAGFTSDAYDLTVRARPNLRDFAVQITYPAYLNKPTETLRNAGNLTVPEGSTVRWDFATEATDQLQLLFQNPRETVTATAADGRFAATRRILRSQEYAVRLQNAASLNRDPIQYQITAIPDQNPEITVESFADTTSLRYLALGGTVRDDYGLSRLQLHYRVTSKARPNAEFRARALALQSGPSQSYTYQWDLAPLNMKPGDRLEYFVQVWDNDGVHGPKAARTRAAEFRLPSKKELRQQLASQSASVQSQLSKSKEQSKKLERELAKASDKIKTKRELNFQDRKQLQDMLQQKQQMDEQIADMKKLFEELNQKQDQLDPQSQKLAEKAQELQKLMESLLDPETKKLYEQLQKLLQEQKAPDVDLQKLMQKLENKENTLQKELERALEMFKQLQFEQKQEQATEKLEQLAQEQEKLAEQTEKNDKDNQPKGDDKKQQQQKQEDLKKQQAEKSQQFEELKKDLQDLKKMDEQLGNENGADEMKDQQQQVDEQQQESEEQLSKNQNKKASQSQQKAAQQMKQMAQKMRQQQQQDEQDQQQQNIDDLRDILENLLKLSFDEESLMKQLRQVDQTDPRFVQLGQQQRKLRDDAAIIQDSLYALAKRVPQLQSFVTREVGEMNGRMDEALEHMRQRSVPRATGSQQLAMTSMNNLALMLNDALQQMQQEQREGQQSQQQGGGKPGKKKKKGSSAGDGQMGRMQQQLNQQIQQLQQSGKTGRAMSEELAKLAAQQQMLRQALKELDKLQQKGGKGTKDGKGEDGVGGTGDVKKLMEQTETDLVNKRLTEQTVLRQRQILTRLLEVEKSARERDQDEKREAQTAQTRPPVFPPAFNKYKQQKNRQTELLRTVPPALTPYYQREVSEYFQKMK